VLSKCANPACLARFHYLHEGRIFNVDRGTVASDRNSSAIRKIEHFWLCERCAQALTVVLENGAVATRPLRLELAEGAVQEKFGGKRNVA
jgi:hypothetical protein